MGPGIQIGVGALIGVAIFAAFAIVVGRPAGADRAIAALGWSALGVMLLADLLLVGGLTQASGSSFSPVSLLVTGLQVGAVSLALLALVLMLMGDLIGVVSSVRHRRFTALGVQVGALVALVAGVALTLASTVDQTPLSSAAHIKAMAFAGFGLGTLAAALIALWAVRMSRRAAVSAEVA